MTLTGLLIENARLRPDKDAYVMVDREGHPKSSLSYRQLLSRVTELKNRLAGQVAQHDRVMIVLPMGLNFVEMFFTVLALGGIPIASHIPHPMFWKKSRARLQGIAKSCQPKVWLTEKRYVDSIEDLYSQNRLEAAKIILTSEMILKLPEDHSSLERKILSHDTALIQYTSGTQSDPKGVVLTHQNIISNLKAICEQTQQDENCRLVSWLPHSHDMGLIGGLLVPFMCGGTSYLLETVDFLRDPLSWLKAISVNQATASPSPMFGFDLCSKAIEKKSRLPELDLSTWKIAFNGAEPISIDSISRFCRNFESAGFREETMYPCYGLAEATLMVTGSSSRRTPQAISVDRQSLSRGIVKIVDSSAPEHLAEKKLFKIVSCGKPVGEVEVRIFDSNENKILKELEVGEIWIKGSSVSSEFWGDSVGSLSTRKNSKTKLGDDFLHTHDVGFLSKGELYVIGRSDDVLIVRGEKYYPEDIEKCIRSADPRIQDQACAVIGLTEENERFQVLCEIDQQSILNQLEIKNIETVILKEMREHFLIGAQIQFLKSGTLKRTTSGKISRNASKALWRLFD